MKGLEMVKCESLRMNMYRITHTGKSVNFPVTDHLCFAGTNFSPIPDAWNSKIYSKN